MNPNLQIKSPLRGPGVYPIVRRGDPLKHLSFTVVELGAGLREYAADSGEEELAVDFYPGSVRVEVDSPACKLVRETHRRSIGEVGEMLYAPPGSRLRLTLLGDSVDLSLDGAIDFDGTLDLVMDIQYSNAVVEGASITGGLAPLMVRQAGNSISQHHVGGTLKEPKYEKMLIPSPRSVGKKLAGTISNI